MTKIWATLKKEYELEGNSWALDLFDTMDELEDFLEAEGPENYNVYQVKLKPVRATMKFLTDVEDE